MTRHLIQRPGPKLPSSVRCSPPANQPVDHSLLAERIAALERVLGG